jgi:hypothetical protein
LLAINICSTNSIVNIRVVDPDWFNTDPDPAFLLNPDPDPVPDLVTDPELSNLVYFLLKFF